jgi:hypothetical protein
MKPFPSHRQASHAIVFGCCRISAATAPQSYFFMSLRISSTSQPTPSPTKPSTMQMIAERTCGSKTVCTLSDGIECPGLLWGWRHDPHDMEVFLSLPIPPRRGFRTNQQSVHRATNTAPEVRDENPRHQNRRQWHSASAMVAGRILHQSEPEARRLTLQGTTGLIARAAPMARQVT